MIDSKSLPSPRDPAEALAAVVALRRMANKLERRTVKAALVGAHALKIIASMEYGVAVKALKVMAVDTHVLTHAVDAELLSTQSKRHFS